jgi:hypothetical protein
VRARDVASREKSQRRRELRDFADLRPLDRLELLRRLGTLAPFSRASLSPIAIACFRLFTFRPEPLLSVPFFRRRMADSTRFDAPFPYFAMSHQKSVVHLDSVEDRRILRQLLPGGSLAGWKRPCQLL